MRQVFGTVLLFAAFAASASGAGKGPEIQIIDHKVSISAEAIPLSRLLGLLDRVSGMTSKVPPELANRNVSVRFTGLTFDDAIKKIFEGQAFDYVMVGGQGIVVTALSMPSTGNETAAAPVARALQDQPGFQPPIINQDNNNGIPGAFGGVPQAPGMPGAPGVANNNPANNNVVNNPATIGRNQSATIQTPFGPIPNPNANTNGNAVAPTNGAPMVFPGQQPSGGSQQNGNGTLGGTLGSPIPTFNPSSSLPGQRNP